MFNVTHKACHSNSAIHHLAICTLIFALSACGGGGGGGSYVGNQNDSQPPVAQGEIVGLTVNTDLNYRARANSEIVLTGKNSFSNNSPILKYQWQQTAGETVRLVERSNSSVGFKAPNSQTPLQFELTVTDANNKTGTDEITLNILPIADVNHFLADPATPDNQLHFLVALQEGVSTGLQAQPLQLSVETVIHWRNRAGDLDQLTTNTEIIDAEFPANFSATIGYDPFSNASNPVIAAVIPRLNADDVNANFESQNRDRRLDPYNISTAYIELQVRVLSTTVPFQLFAMNNAGQSIQANLLDTFNQLISVTNIEKSLVAGSGVNHKIINARQLNAPSNSTNNNANGALLQTWLGQTEASLLATNTLNQLGIENSITASNYYNLIDPEGQYATLDNWLIHAGFKDANGKTIDDPSIAHALYVNNYDLGFGRDMYLRKAENGNVYTYVTNYPTVESGLEQRLEFAVVAMEYSENPDPAGANPKIVKFWAFIQDERTGQFVRVNSMNFDGRGEKFLPNVCTACHQSFPGIGKQFTSAAEADINATFIPWDLDSFLYAKANDPNLVEPTLTASDYSAELLEKFSRENQELEFKKLNLGALATYTGQPQRHAAAIQLVHGWYGDEALELPIDQLPEATTFNGRYTQPGWAQEADLYHDVYARNCRICHTQMANTDKNFDSYEELLANPKLVNYIYEQGLMPLARLSMDRFWVPFVAGDESAAEQLRTHIIARGNTTLTTDTVPGSALADFSLVPANPSIDDTVIVDASSSKFSLSYAWALTAKPANSLSALSNDKGLISSLQPDIPASEFEVTLTVTNDAGAQNSLSKTLTTIDRIPKGDCLVADSTGLTSTGLLAGIPVISRMTDLGDGIASLVSTANGSLGTASMDTGGQTFSYQLNNPFIRGSDTILFQIQDQNGSRSQPGLNCTGQSTVTIDTTVAGTFAPTGLAATPNAVQDSSSLDVSWQAPSAIVPDSYKLFRDDVEIADQTQTSFTDTGLASNTSYRYTVSSIVDGFASNVSTPATAATLDLLPTALSLSVAGPTIINLDWVAPAGNRNNTGDPTSYTIYRSSAAFPALPAAPTIALPATTLATDAIDSGLTPGLTYSYAIAAQTSVNTSTNTTAVNATTTPLPPTNVNVTEGPDARTQVALSWSAPSGNTSHYVVARKEGAGAYSDIATPTQTSYTDIGLNEVSTYTYQVTSAAGTALSDTVTSAAITTASAADGQPSGFNATVDPTANASQIVLSWTPPSAYVPDSYVLKRDNNGDGVYVVVDNCCVGNATQFTDLALAPNSTHNYQLIAVIGSLEANYVTDVASTLSLTPSFNSAVVVSDSAITLSWNNPPATVDSYTLSRAGLTLNNATSGFTDTALSPGTTYTYVLTAIQGSATASTTQAVTSAPTDPSALTISGNTTTSLTLNWTPATGNGDDAAIVYDIYRDATLIAQNLPISSAPYLDTGLTTGTLYNYSVFAKANGERSKSSADNSATTLPSAPNLTSAVAQVPKSTDSIVLSWSANTGPAVTGYNIYRTDYSSTVPIKANLNALSYTDTTDADPGSVLAPATGYSYFITALSAGGESAASLTLTGSTYPAVPQTVTATVVSASDIDVSWSANGNGANVSYTVTDNTGTAINNIFATSQRASALAGYTAYTFNVVASANGLSSNSAASSPATTKVSYANNVQSECESCHSAGGHFGLNGTPYDATTNPNGVSSRFPACLPPTGAETRCDSASVMPLYPTSGYGYKMIMQWIAEGRDATQ